MSDPAPLRLDLRAARLPGIPPAADPPVSQPPCPPRGLDRQQAWALNALMRRRAPLMLREGGRQVALHLRPLAPPDHGAPWLSLTVDGAAAAVAIPWPALRRVAGIPLEAARPEDAALLIEDALAPWLDAAEQLTGLALRLDRLDRAAPDLPGALEVMLGVEATVPRPVRQPLALRLSPGAAAQLAGALGRWTRPREAMPQLALRVAIELDSLRLPLAELRGLAPGDALMLPEDAAPRPARAVVEGRLAAPVSPAGDGLWRLTAAFAPRRDEPSVDPGPARGRAGPLPPDTAPLRLTETMRMTQTPDPHADAAATTPRADPPTGAGPSSPAAPPAAALSALDDLELRVSFRLGEALMTLTELREAAPGAVIALDRPDGAPVDIVVNGQVIGTGQIISVAGQRACEIVTLFGDG